VEISVVVPVYNGERYLGGCLDSVARAVEALAPADRARVEVVVCDNHSTDGSLALAGAAVFACEGRVVQPPVHEENRTRNWAYGLAQGRGRWLMMLHHDDLMAPGGLAAQLRHAVSAPEDVVLISGRHRTFDDPAAPDRPRPTVAPRAVVSGRAMRERVLALHCPFVPFLLMRRDAYEAVGGLDERWQLVQDWDLWLRLLERGDLLVHGDEVAWWRQHPTSGGYRLMNAREQVQIARALPALVPTLSPRALARARAAGLDRAALQIAGMDAPPAPEQLDWLDGDALPEIGVARRRLRATRRRVALTQAALRLAAAARRRR
jgi:glycosyltransferase involved in cell wall biosynthesis